MFSTERHGANPAGGVSILTCLTANLILKFKHDILQNCSFPSDKKFPEKKMFRLKIDKQWKKYGKTFGCITLTKMGKV
jgi:hypothetical protein